VNLVPGSDGMSRRCRLREGNLTRFQTDLVIPVVVTAVIARRVRRVR